MSWIFWSFLAASAVHMFEEYGFPGGFMETMRRQVPKFAQVITVPFAIIINGLQIVLCFLVIWDSGRHMIFDLSIASLVLVNGFVHSLGTILKKRYIPGTLSGLVLYLPLSIFTYSMYFRLGSSSINLVIFSSLLGILYQAAPLACIGALYLLRKRKDIPV